MTEHESDIIAQLCQPLDEHTAREECADLCDNCYKLVRSKVKGCKRAGRSFDYVVAIISGIIGTGVGGYAVLRIVNALWRLPT